MKSAAAKNLSKLLNFDQNQRRMRCSCDHQAILTTLNDDPDLLTKIVTGEESWVCGYDIETKAQSSQWKRSKTEKSA